MDFFDTDVLLYLIIILGILLVFLWSKRLGKKRRTDQRAKSFRKRYEDRRGGTSHKSSSKKEDSE